ncbi:transmembrane protease serine 11D-like [Daphnia pulex]|uniref:transmembrane protease serine 11D-like n=1 Tax=Daphnia pulex TaxID=6669 RepID=UPI001EE021D3|nr:transmembrane protease serine 11D-like [Daphnia pulex]XP_046457594.1 transmembrane protease serine 11D-like [Daphnia pulex]XP_046457595.1 transmembrane protease serine 11D-like [Daphnia pulex]XP_046457596.1 transmembrane protease serine 11D-like [Daphnia pulex]
MFFSSSARFVTSVTVVVDRFIQQIKEAPDSRKLTQTFGLSCTVRTVQLKTILNWCEMMANSLTIFSFVSVISLLLLSCSSQATNLNNTSDSTTIQGDDVSGSRSARQYMMPGLLMNYRQHAPSNIFDRWIYAPSNFELPTVAESPNVEYDGRNLLGKAKFQIACGGGPAALPQRQIVGIVGGSQAAKNSWPFVVALMANGQVLCGGSLISPTKILTAAHCVERMSLFEISLLTVRLGMHTVGNQALNTRNDAQVTRRVSRVVFHNDYNDATSANDIAILTMDKAVTYSSVISPVCLGSPSSNADQFADKQAAVMGWGNLQEGGNPADVLQQVTLQIITNAKCKASFPDLLTTMLCAIAPGKDSCQGDSGGPLVVQSASGIWTQVGIVSFGRGCAQPDFPGVYTRVSAFRSWIDKFA